MEWNTRESSQNYDPAWELLGRMNVTLRVKVWEIISHKQSVQSEFELTFNLQHKKKKVLETNLFGRNSEFCNKLCLFIGCLQSIFKHISEKICRKDKNHGYMI